MQNIGSIQEKNSIPKDVKRKSNIIDIMMETGTGKIYTYTKTIFKFNNWLLIVFTGQIFIFVKTT